MVEGRVVGDIVLDRGCSRTSVRKNLIPMAKMMDGATMTIRCAYGDTVLCPLANVEMEIRGRKMVVEVAVSKMLPASALLGMDALLLAELLDSESPKPKQMLVEAFVVRTRAQTRQLQREEEQQSEMVHNHICSQKLNQHNRSRTRTTIRKKRTRRSLQP